MTSMEKLLQEKNCYLRDRVQDWKEAVHIACEPLIEQNYCQRHMKLPFTKSQKGLVHTMYSVRTWP